MTKAFVKVGMQIVAYIAPLVNHVACCIVDNKLLSKSVAACSLIVSVR